MAKKIVGLAALVLLISCAPIGQVDSARFRTEDEIAVAHADALFEKGSFVALRQAREQYQSLHERSKLRRAMAPKLFMTSVLLSVREKELGISNTAYLDRALA